MSTRRRTAVLSLNRMMRSDANSDAGVSHSHVDATRTSRGHTLVYHATHRSAQGHWSVQVRDCERRGMKKSGAVASTEPRRRYTMRQRRQQQSPTKKKRWLPPQTVSRYAFAKLRKRPNAPSPLAFHFPAIMPRSENMRPAPTRPIAARYRALSAKFFAEPIVDSHAVLVDDIVASLSVRDWMPSDAPEAPSVDDSHAALVDDIVASLSTTAALNDVLHGVVPPHALAAGTAQRKKSASY